MCYVSLPGQFSLAEVPRGSSCRETSRSFPSEFVGKLPPLLKAGSRLSHEWVGELLQLTSAKPNWTGSQVPSFLCSESCRGPLPVTLRRVEIPPGGPHQSPSIFPPPLSAGAAVLPKLQL